MRNVFQVVSRPILTGLLIILILLPIRICYADVLDGDSRLNSLVSIHLINAPVRDVLAEISQQSGVTLFTEGEVADDKVSVNAVNRKAIDLLHALLPVFHYVVSNRYSNKINAYSIRTDSGYVSRATSEHLAASEAIATQIINEGKWFEKYGNYTNDELEMEAAGLPMKVASAKDPVEILNTRSRLAVTQTLLSKNLWMQTIYAMLEKLPRARLVKAIEDEGIWFFFPGITADKAVISEVTIPRDLVDRAQRLSRDNPSLPSVYRGSALRSIRIHLFPTNRRDAPFQWEISVAQGQSRFTTVMRQSGSLPLVAPDETLIRPIIASHSVSSNSKNLLSLMVDVTPPYMDSPGYYADNGDRTCRLGDVLSAVSEKVPFDFVADAYWSGHFKFEEYRNISLGDVLSRISKLAVRNWNESHGFQTFSPISVYDERRCEPPATRMAHWQELIDHGQFAMDEFAELASLDERMKLVMMDMSRFGVMPPFVAQLQISRSHLALWNGLDRNMRRLAQSDGIAYKDLPANLQHLYMLAATDPAMTQYTQLITESSSVTQSRMKITSMDVQQWRVRKPGPTATWRIGRGEDPENGYMNRDEALRRFQMLDKTIKLKDVVPVVQTTVSLTYMTPEQTISRGFLELPLRWESSE